MRTTYRKTFMVLGRTKEEGREELERVLGAKYSDTGELVYLYNKKSVRHIKSYTDMRGITYQTFKVTVSEAD